ncbi:DUF4386 domain-containing protein [Actinomadura sp. ATCC 39365]
MCSGPVSWKTICVLACTGTAVVLFPVVKRQNEAAALGFVAARILEAAIIVVGILSLFAVVSLRQPGATGADADSLDITGKALVAIHNWTFLLGPDVIPAVNALLPGYLLYRSRLVPRVIPAVGLIGAPLLLLSSIAVTFGLYSQVSCCRASRPCRYSFGRGRSASGWPSRASGPPPHHRDGRRRRPDRRPPMKTTRYDRSGSDVGHAARSPRTAGLIAGLALVLMTVLAVFGNFIVVDALITPDDAGRTAGDLSGSELLFRWGIVALVLVAVLNVIVAGALLTLFEPAHRATACSPPSAKWCSSSGCSSADAG